MLKTISAALLAASMVAAPALAAGTGTNAQAPAGTNTQAPANNQNQQAQNPATKTGQTGTQAKATSTKHNKMNANARMLRHHPRHRSSHSY